MSANQATLEAQGAAIMAKLDAMNLKLDEVLPIQTTREVLENGEATGVLITSERFPQAMLEDIGLVPVGVSGDGTQHSDS
jgi:hypothetical protein